MSSHPPRSSVPLAQPIGRALESSPALARLGERLRESNARFAAVRDALPEGLRAHVRPGPVDEAGWSLLAANASVAAKLRQLVPVVDAALREKGFQAIATRIRVQSG
jgi:hypothetical protein